MELNNINNRKSFFFASSSVPLLLFLVIATLSAPSASSSFISGDTFDYHASTGRNLLQVKKNCPVNFEFLNYTIITSQCKAPEYLADPCCNSFKEFACPYAHELNDLTNNCSSTMMDYINLKGKYPDVLFANLCHDGKDGLDCPATPPSPSQKDAGPALLASYVALLGFGLCVFECVVVTSPKCKNYLSRIRISFFPQTKNSETAWLSQCGPLCVFNLSLYRRAKR